MSEDDDTEKTEDASPERRKRARDDGQFPRSKDSGPVAATIAALGIIGATAGDFVGTIRAFSLRCFDDPLSLVRGDVSALAEQAGMVLVTSCVPVALAAALAGMAVGFLEAGFHPNFELLEVKLERLDPISKLGQMFSPKSGAMSIVMSVLRLVVVGVVAESVMEKEFPKLTRLARAPLGAAVWETAQVVMQVAIWSTLALGLIAALDYGWSWWRHEQSIKMSRQELKDEHKSQEGSPQIRQRQRARAREMMKRGLRKGVREATVIVANPTHVAVALRYKQHEGAPVVTTKGYDEIALQIKKLAKEEGIPIIENRPLARALAERVRVGRVIPADLYVAVAELLAMVYRLKIAVFALNDPRPRPRPRPRPIGFRRCFTSLALTHEIGDKPAVLKIDLTGRRAFVVGIADDGGFGFAIAKTLAEAGASVIAGTWPPAMGIFEKLLERGKLDASRKMSDGSLLSFERVYPVDAAFDTLEDAPQALRESKRYASRGDFSLAGAGELLVKDFGEKPLDIVIHCLANGPEVHLPLLKTSRAGYLAAVGVSAYSLVSMVQRYAPLMRPGGSFLSLTYLASERVIPGYGGGMHAAKAALESDTRVLAYEAGRQYGVRVNTISAGPYASRAASVTGIIDDVVAYYERNAPIQEKLTTVEVANTAAFLSSSLATGITGATMYVDKGYHAMGKGADPDK